MAAFQYASDLHFNYGTCRSGNFGTMIEPVSPTLVVAGDVTAPNDPAYRSFLAWCSANFRDTVLIAGNHEYLWAARDGYSLSDTDAVLRDMCNNLGNVHYLSTGGMVDTGGVRFVGSCLWYAPTDADSETAFEHSYGGIRTVARSRLSVSYARDSVRMFVSTLAKRAEHAAELGMPTVAVTHFAPLRWCGASKDCHDLSAFFPALRDSGVRAWVFGHTHVNADGSVHGINVIANQNGRNDLGGRSFERSKVAVVAL